MFSSNNVENRCHRDKVGSILAEINQKHAVTKNSNMVVVTVLDPPTQMVLVNSMLCPYKKLAH